MVALVVRVGMMFSLKDKSASRPIHVIVRVPTSIIVRDKRKPSFLSRIC